MHERLIDRVSRVRFGLRLSLEPLVSSEVAGGGRYRTRTYDLVRVKQRQSWIDED
jgi:hypothetical protein